jgi:hypothetical protein
MSSAFSVWLRHLQQNKLLRLIREQQEHQISTPRVLGVDDFCFCRRRSYGAILIEEDNASDTLQSRNPGK